MEKRLISFVIPCFNEEGNVKDLYSELIEQIKKIGQHYEIIFVNDGSEDNTLDVLLELKERHKEIKIVSFDTNFGKTRAYLEGFRESKGEIICTLDADLQDSPREIPNVLKKLDEGYDLVTGWRNKRKDVKRKKVSSLLFNKLVSLLFNENFNDLNCGLKVFKREVFECITLYGELHRFIPLIAKLHGFSVAELEIEHFPRRHGKTKYGFERVFSATYGVLSLLFIYRFCEKPLYFFGSTGSLISTCGISIILYYELRKLLFGIVIGPGRPLITFAFTLIVLGLQFITIGLIGELVTYYFQKYNPRNIKKKII
jgi:glycosyltransferase involved in cell wall biosynthesis